MITEGVRTDNGIRVSVVMEQNTGSGWKSACVQFVIGGSADVVCETNLLRCSVLIIFA